MSTDGEKLRFVLFRTDASASIGMGHLSRCLVLANELSKKGFRALFLMRNPSETAQNLVRAKGHELRLLDGLDPDAAVSAARGLVFVGLVVDHYEIDAKWEKEFSELNPCIEKILVIDDLHDRPHSCHGLCDPTFGRREREYAQWVPAGCELFMGAPYAMIREEILAVARIPRRTSAGAGEPRIFVNFGGSDPIDATRSVLECLMSAPELALARKEVVVGADYSGLSRLRAAAARDPRVRIHVQPKDFAEILAGCDAAVGAVGGSIVERCLLGVPSVIAAVADNQRESLARYVELGVAEEFDLRKLDSGVLLSKLRSVLSRRDAMGVVARKLYDGLGAQRLASFFTRFDAPPPSAESFRRSKNAMMAERRVPAPFVNKASRPFHFKWITDCETEEVLAVRNAPHVLDMSGAKGPISEKNHLEFLARYRSLDRIDFMFVGDQDGSCIGGVNVVLTQYGLELGKYIGDKRYLGSGVAKQGVRHFLEFLRREFIGTTLVARTKNTNYVNIELNKSLGFMTIKTLPDDFILMSQVLS